MVGQAPTITGADALPVVVWRDEAHSGRGVVAKPLLAHEHRAPASPRGAPGLQAAIMVQTQHAQTQRRLRVRHRPCQTLGQPAPSSSSSSASAPVLWSP